MILNATNVAHSEAPLWANVLAVGLPRRQWKGRWEPLLRRRGRSRRAHREKPWQPQAQDSFALRLGVW